MLLVDWLRSLLPDHRGNGHLQHTQGLAQERVPDQHTWPANISFAFDVDGQRRELIGERRCMVEEGANADTIVAYRRQQGKDNQVSSSVGGEEGQGPREGKQQ